MNKIYQYYLQEANLNIDDVSTDKIAIVKTLNNKFSITTLDRCFSIIKVGEDYLPLINRYVERYQEDLFSKNAVDFIKTHFRLNSTENPCTYIYGLSDASELSSDMILDSTMKIDLPTLLALNPIKT